MPISLPSQLHFDPYHESGITLTHSPNQVRLQLPPLGIWSMFPLYLLSGIIWLFALLIVVLSIIQFQWHNFWYLPLVILFGSGPTLLARYFSSYRGTVELTPDHLVITQWAWLQSPQTFRFPWDQLVSCRFGILTAEQTQGMSGFIITTRDGKETRTLPFRSVGELERIENLLNPLIPRHAAEMSVV